MNWSNARANQPEVTTILRDGRVYRETRFGTVQKRRPAPPLDMDAQMRALFDAFDGLTPAAQVIAFSDMEAEVL